MTGLTPFLAGFAGPSLIAVWGWAWCQHERVQRCRADMRAALSLEAHERACHEWMHAELLLEDEIAGRKREVEAYQRLQEEMRAVEAERDELRNHPGRALRDIQIKREQKRKQATAEKQAGRKAELDRYVARQREIAA